MDKAEASKVLAKHLISVVQKSIENTLDNYDDISIQPGLVNRIVYLFQNTTQKVNCTALMVTQYAESFLALLREQTLGLAVGKPAINLDCSDHRRCSGLHLSGDKKLCDAQGAVSHEHCLKIGPVNPSKVFEENQGTYYGLRRIRMTELEKIAYARTYIEKLANGLDPLTNQAVPDTECINNVRVSRCLFYVSDILRQLVENGEIPHRKSQIAKAPFSLDCEARKSFQYSDVPIPISEITKRLNALIPPEEMKKITYRQLSDWLIRDGFLQLVPNGAGKTTRTPTATGVELGITLEDRQGAKGPYTVIVYNKTAQQFILDHLDTAIT